MTDPVAACEDEHEPIRDAPPAGVLRELMDSHGPTQERRASLAGIPGRRIKAAAWLANGISYAAFVGYTGVRLSRAIAAAP